MTAVTGPSTASTLTATLVLSSAVQISNGTTRTRTLLRLQRTPTSVTIRNASAAGNPSTEGTTSATTSAIITRKTFRSAVPSSAMTGSKAETLLAIGGAAHAVSSVSTSPETATNAPGATLHARPSGRRKGARSDETHEASHRNKPHLHQCFSQGWCACIQQLHLSSSCTKCNTEHLRGKAKGDTKKEHNHDSRQPLFFPLSVLLRLPTFYFSLANMFQSPLLISVFSFPSCAPVACSQFLTPCHTLTHLAQFPTRRS